MAARNEEATGQTQQPNDAHRRSSLINQLIDQLIDQLVGGVGTESCARSAAKLSPECYSSRA
jgi:hypothetical protein